MFRRLVLLIASLWLLPAAHAATAANDTLIAGSQRDDFVTVSLLLASPGNAVYSVFGHCGLRMQCPSQRLDYVYTFEMESGLTGCVKFFAGQAKAGFAAVPTEEYLSLYRKEGRGVKSYTINLKPHEKQELWRALDEDMEQGPHRKYNLIRNQCLSTSLLTMEEVLEDEHFEFRRLPEILYVANEGEGLRYSARKSPWASFIFLTFLGTDAEVFWDTEYRLTPEAMPFVLKYARIVSNDLTQSRPMLKGAPRTLVPATLAVKPSPLSPDVVFGALLLFALLLTWAQRRGRWQDLGRGFDLTLFVLQSAAGIFLLYVTLVTGLFGRHWNWYLIPFNPLPLLLWAVFRHRPWYRSLYTLYGIALTAFIPLMFLLTTQADAAHALIAATLAVRSLRAGTAKPRAPR
jgi:hypothetical protein